MVNRNFTTVKMCQQSHEIISNLALSVMDFIASPSGGCELKTVFKLHKTTSFTIMTSA